MPVTVHKILTHSMEVIKSCILPNGQLSKESNEARSKDCKRFREHHTRKQFFCKLRFAKYALNNI